MMVTTAIGHTAFIASKLDRIAARAALPVANHQAKAVEMRTLDYE